jgi:Immunoglobulin domain
MTNKFNMSMVVVTEEPQVSTSPSRQTFVVGATVHIACTAVAYPKPTFVWRRHGFEEQNDESGDIDGQSSDGIANSDRVSFDNDGHLTITDATREDAGDWECTATNSLGTGTATAVLDYIG